MFRLSTACCRILRVAFLIFLLGCDPVDETQMYADDESETVVAVVIDLSGSFQQQMVQNGAGFEFVMYAIDTYFQSRTGSKDVILLAQISANQRCLLWQGTPAELQEQFPDATAFRNFLISRGDPDASLVNHGISRAIEELMHHRNVASGKAKACLLVVSDMVDTGPDRVESEKELMKAFTNFLRKGGVMGLYHCDELEMFKWRKNFEAAGYQLVTIEGGHNGKPALPKILQ